MLHFLQIFVYPLYSLPQLSRLPFYQVPSHLHVSKANLIIFLFAYRLAGVNSFLACVGVTQLSRIFLYQRSLKNENLTAAVKEDARELKDSAAGVVSETKGAVRQAIK